MKNKLMTHVVAGYPTESECIELLLGMQAAGVYAIEVQIPFSDPGADGPTIMKANDIALQNGMTTSKCFQMIKLARQKGLRVPVYIMSYANKLYRFGFEDFCQEAKSCQVNGFIVPDLPFDTPEYKELSNYAKKLDIVLIPVLSPGITTERLSHYTLDSSKLVYLTSMKGITGKELVVKKELVSLVEKIRSTSSCQIALGFGIRNAQHVHTALEVADIAVVGSEVIRRIEQKGLSGAATFIKELTNNEGETR